MTVHPLVRAALTWWVNWLAATFYPLEVALGLDDPVKKEKKEDDRPMRKDEHEARFKSN